MAGKGLQQFTVQESQNAGLGQVGSIFISGVATVTCKGGVFIAITMLEDTVFNLLTAEELQLYPSSTGTGSDVSTTGGVITGSEVFPKGITIYGRWTAFSLTSGLVVAYRGS